MLDPSQLSSPKRNLMSPYGKRIMGAVPMDESAGAGVRSINRLPTVPPGPGSTGRRVVNLNQSSPFNKPRAFV